MKYLTSIAITTCLFFLGVSPGFAASISYSPVSSQQSFLQTDEINLHVTLSLTAVEGTTYYLRGVFYKEGSSNYCGFTWNGSTFYSGPYTTNEGWKNFLKASISGNIWNGDMKVKIDADDSGCRDSSTYKFKIQRFTESGSGSFDSQDSLSFSFVLPTPTPTLIPTLKPTATPSPTPIPKVTTSSKTSTPIPTSFVDSSIQSQSLHNSSVSVTSPENLNYKHYQTTSSAVLTAASKSAEEKRIDLLTPTPLPVRVLSSATSVTAMIFSTIGVGIFSLCAILAVRIYKQNQ